MQKKDQLKSAYLDGFIAKHSQYNPTGGPPGPWKSPEVAAPTPAPNKPASTTDLGKVVGQNVLGTTEVASTVGRAAGALSQAGRVGRVAGLGVRGARALGAWGPGLATAFDLPSALLHNPKSDKVNTNVRQNLEAHRSDLNDSVERRPSYPGQVLQNAYNIMTSPIASAWQAGGNLGEAAAKFRYASRMGSGKPTTGEVTARRMGLPAGAKNVPSTTSPGQYPKILSDKVTGIGKNSAVKGNAMNKYSESELSYLEGFVKSCEKLNVDPAQIIKSAQGAGVGEIIGAGLKRIHPGAALKSLWHHTKGLVPMGKQMGIKPEGLTGTPIRQALMNGSVTDKVTQYIPRDITLGNSARWLGAAGVGADQINKAVNKTTIPENIKPFVQPSAATLPAELTKNIIPSDPKTYPGLNKLIGTPAPTKAEVEAKQNRAIINARTAAGTNAPPPVATNAPSKAVVGPALASKVDTQAQPGVAAARIPVGPTSNIKRTTAAIYNAR